MDTWAIRLADSRMSSPASRLRSIWSNKRSTISAPDGTDIDSRTGTGTDNSPCWILSRAHRGLSISLRIPADRQSDGNQLLPAPGQRTGQLSGKPAEKVASGKRRLTPAPIPEEYRIYNDFYVRSAGKIIRVKKDANSSWSSQMTNMTRWTTIETE